MPASRRDETLSVDKVDEEYIVNFIRDSWRKENNSRWDFLNRVKNYEAGWRDLTGGENVGPWENSANFKSKLILKYGKAIHARLWQMFSNPNGFYQVKARQEPFKDKEVQIKEFMDFILERYCNSGIGSRAEFDQWLWDVVMRGSGFIMCYWKREEHEYTDLVSQVTSEESTIFDQQSPTGRPDVKIKVEEVDQVITDIKETPQIRRIDFEDIAIPYGFTDPQDCPGFSIRCTLSDDDLKNKANSGLYDKQRVEEAIKHRQSMIKSDYETANIKQNRRFIDGQDDHIAYSKQNLHVIYEYYGACFIDPKVEEPSFDDDISKEKKEIVAWVHAASGTLLGWTYLHRISPGGIRPVFKADYVLFPDRPTGVGVAELVYEEQRFDEAITNMRVDNGMLASIPMFAYRQGTGFKPQQYRVRPGHGLPVDDINDIKMLQFPFLQGFGYQEVTLNENRAEGILAISEINLGRAPDKVGALRNATGSNLLASESNIQLQIHFDRVARAVSRLLQFLFRLCRERIPEKLYYRITSDVGEAVFGRIDRTNLKGEYDFDIAVDILGQSELERQQKAVLTMQTLISPAFMQTGVVTPSNLYNMGKQFLIANKVSRPTDFITEPQGYVEDMLTAPERLYRLVIGMFDNPKLEDTVRLDEDHAKALTAYEAFKKSDNLGLLSPHALAVLNMIEEKHKQMLQAATSGGNPNLTGMQVPREGLIPPQGRGQQQAMQGQPNGIGGEAPNGPII